MSKGQKNLMFEIIYKLSNEKFNTIFLEFQNRFVIGQKGI